MASSHPDAGHPLLKLHGTSMNFHEFCSLWMSPTSATCRIPFTQQAKLDDKHPHTSNPARNSASGGEWRLTDASRDDNQAAPQPWPQNAQDPGGHSVSHHLSDASQPLSGLLCLFGSLRFFFALPSPLLLLLGNRKKPQLRDRTKLPRASWTLRISSCLLRCSSSLDSGTRSHSLAQAIRAAQQRKADEQRRRNATCRQLPRPASASCPLPDRNRSKLRRLLSHLSEP